MDSEPLLNRLFQSGTGGSGEELRRVFQAVAGGARALTFAKFQGLLRAPRGGDLLPDGFIASLWSVWTVGGAEEVGEARFLEYYRIYVQGREQLLTQWLLATSNNPRARRRLLTSEAFRKVCAQCESSGKLGVSFAQFSYFCNAFAREDHEPPPPQGFAHAVFGAIMGSVGDLAELRRSPVQPVPAGDVQPNTEMPLTVFKLGVEIYASRWREWLDEWADQTGALLRANRREIPRTIRDVFSHMAHDLTTLEFEFLFKHFDSEGAGSWSSSDLWDMLKQVSMHDREPVPPRTFAEEVVAVIHKLAQKAGGGATGRPERITYEQARRGLQPFLRKRHELLKAWLTVRLDAIFECPCCSNRLRLRYGGDGEEVLVLASAPRGVAWHRHVGITGPRSAAGLVPSGSEVAAVHDATSRSVAAGRAAVLLAGGMNRSALAARLLLEAASTTLGKALLLVAPEAELQVSSRWLRTLAPESQVLILGADAGRLRPSAGRAFYVCSHSRCLTMVRSASVALKDISFVVCCYGIGDTPLVRELNRLAPFSMSDQSPRVVHILDGRDPKHAKWTDLINTGDMHATSEEGSMTPSAEASEPLTPGVPSPGAGSGFLDTASVAGPAAGRGQQKASEGGSQTDARSALPSAPPSQADEDPWRFVLFGSAGVSASDVGSASVAAPEAPATLTPLAQSEVGFSGVADFFGFSGVAAPESAEAAQDEMPQDASQSPQMLAASERTEVSYSGFQWNLFRPQSDGAIDADGAGSEISSVTTPSVTSSRPPSSFLTASEGASFF